MELYYFTNKEPNKSMESLGRVLSDSDIFIKIVNFIKNKDPSGSIQSIERSKLSNEVHQYTALSGDYIYSFFLYFDK